MAVAAYHDVEGHFPPPYVLGPDGKPWHSWRVLILPYIEHDDLFKQYRFDEPWDGPHNRTLADRMPRIYRFHNRTERGQTTTNYLAVVGANTIWPGTEKRKYADITDGSSNTVLIAENRGLGVNWMEPRDLDLDTIPLEFNHPFGVSSWYKTPAVVMADGTIHTFPPGSDPRALRAALTATGGEKLSLDGERWQVLPDGRLRPDGE